MQPVIWESVEIEVIHVLLTGLWPVPVAVSLHNAEQCSYFIYAGTLINRSLVIRSGLLTQTNLLIVALHQFKDSDTYIVTTTFNVV